MNSKTATPTERQVPKVRPRLPAPRQQPVESPAEEDPDKAAFKKERLETKARFKGAKKRESANPDLDLAYHDAGAEKIMRYLELPMDHYDWNQPEDVEISTVMQSKSFPCILHPGRKAIVKRGNDGTWVYGTFKPDSNDPKPIFISLVEVYCRLHHGYGENDPKLIRGHKSIFALYKARLAVAAGVVQIERRPLPIHLPVALLKRLHSPMEADFAITTTITFGLRLDLAHKYTPGPLAKDGCVLFTSDFRDHWARKKGQARPNEKRREAIFKMLVSYGVLKLIRLPYKTGYAFGPCEFQERHSRKEFRAKTMELFLAEFDKTRKVIGDIEEELDS